MYVCMYVFVYYDTLICHSHRDNGTISKTKRSIPNGYWPIYDNDTLRIHTCSRNNSKQSTAKLRAYFMGYAVRTWTTRHNTHSAYTQRKNIFLSVIILMLVNFAGSRWSIQFLTSSAVLSHITVQLMPQPQKVTLTEMDKTDLMMTSSKMVSFSRYWPFARGINGWPVDCPHKG